MAQGFQPVQQRIVFQAPQTNGLGTAGFVCSLLGLLTCGFLSPLGLLFSLFAMLRAPRGMAFAGFCLGMIGSIWLFVAGFAIVAGLVGISVGAGSVIDSEMQKRGGYNSESLLKP